MKKKFDVFAIVLIIIVAIGITSKEFQNDTFYIIKIGESIMKNGIDMIDHFSIHNISYPYEHWLHDILVYGIYSKTGFFGLYISNIIFASLLGFILYFSTKKLYKNKYISLIFTVLVLIMMNNFIATRAQLITYILFALEIYFLEMITKTGKRRYVIYTFLASILCANLHSAVWPMYLVLFLPYFASYLFIKYYKLSFEIKSLKILKKSNCWFIGNNYLDNTLNIKKDNYSNIKVLFFTFLICILSGFINLNHNQCFIHFINLRLGTTLNHIAEHQPIVLYDNLDVFLYLIFIFGYLYKSKQNLSIKNIFLLGGLLLLTISSYRHLALFLVIGVYPIIQLFSNFQYRSNVQKQKMWLFFSVFSIFISIFMFINNYNKKYISNEYPIGAAKYIKQNLQKDDISLYNDYDWGSYLILNNIKVFIDSRASLYTKQFNHLKYDIYEDWRKVSTTGKYKKVFKRYNISHALVKRYSVLDYSLKANSKFKKIYSDKKFVLYEYNK